MAILAGTWATTWLSASGFAWRVGVSPTCRGTAVGASPGSVETLREEANDVSWRTKTCVWAGSLSLIAELVDSAGTLTSLASGAGSLMTFGIATRASWIGAAVEREILLEAVAATEAAEEIRFSALAFRL